MSSVINEVRGGVSTMESTLSGIDLSGIDQIASAAAAASQQAQSSFNNLQASGSAAAGSVGSSMAAAAQQANTALSRIDASALDQIVSGANNAGQALGELDRWQLDALISEANRAGEQLGTALGAGATHAERQLAGLDSASLDSLIREAQRARDEIDQVGDSSDDAEQSTESLGGSLGEMAGAAAGAAAGIAGIAGAVDTVMAAVEQADLGNKLAAQLNLTKEESAQAGEIAGSLYAQNYGESFEQVNEATGAVLSTLGNLADDGAPAIEALTAKALTLASVFDVDVAESTQSVNNLIRQGLVPDAEAGFDMIAKAMQSVPASMRGEILPVMDEYAVTLAAAGLNGSQAMGLIVNASQDGAIAMDKAGDSVKEFMIKATDIGDTGAQEALTGLGLDAKLMANDLLQGGDQAFGAFNQIIEGLEGIVDPTEQAAASVAIFGTPLEDLSKNQIPGFLSQLTNGESAIGDFAGTVDQMGDTMSQGPGAALETLKRGIQQTMIDKLGEAAKFLTEHETLAKVLGITLGVVAGAFVAGGIAIIGYEIAMKAVTATTTIWSNVTKVATAVQKAFTAAFVTSPIGLIVVAVAALVAGLVLFFTKTEVGRQIFEKLKEVMVTAWEAIKNAFMTAWAFIQPILASMAQWIMETLVPAVMSFWQDVIVPAFTAIGEIIAWVWDNIILNIFKAYQFYIMEIIVPAVMFLWQNVIMPAFTAIGEIISFVWNNVIMPVFNLMKGFIEGILIPIILFLWNQVVAPAFDAIGAIISGVWNNIIAPIFNFWKAAFDAAGAVANWLWHEVIEPVFNGIGAVIGFVIDNVVKPAFEGLKGALSTVGDFFRTIVGGIGDVWNGLRNLLAKPINFMIDTVYNKGIAGAWNKIAEFVPGLAKAPQLSTIPEYRVGGPIVGDGTGTSDDILMYGSNGEHMVTAKEVARAGGHNVLYAIRDMIARGVPFEWDGGSVMAKVGRGNLSRYGAAVQRAGIGNVDPEGMFDQLVPRFKDGGALEPWMLQLQKGHEFARAQHGKPYQWAGPTGPGSSFDCSGFMGSIAAAILGGNPWQRYWATGSFGRGQGAGGPQGFVPGVDAGFSIGVTDDPGGPGGGHTAGVLGAVPGLFGVARVESGGSLGDVHYGAGPDVNSFMGQYHLPIGANGFFEPGNGEGGGGPSPEEQKSWLEDKVTDIFKDLMEPIKAGISGAIGSPPPEWVGIPPKYLDRGVEVAVGGAFDAIGGLGDLLSGAWTKAQDTAGDVLDFLNPFDSGGIANGVGFMPKNIINPERVLSPDQTRMFEILVQTLDRITGGAAPVAAAAPPVDLAPVVDAVEEASDKNVAATTESKDLLAEAVDAWADGAIEAPVRAAFEGALGSEEAQKFAESISAGLGDVVSDAVASAGKAIISGSINLLGDAMENVLTGAVDAIAGKERDQWLLKALAKTVGADLPTREAIVSLAKEIRGFKEESTSGFDATGQLISDTAGMLERTETSRAIADQMKKDVATEMVRATINTVLTKILIPALMGLLTALITAGLAALGTAIAGPIGGAIGGAAGMAVGSVIASMLGGTMTGVFDEGGLATGIGVMPKNVIAPERVLSPHQTQSFDRLVDAIAGSGNGGNVSRTTIHAPFTVKGDQATGERVHSRLLSLLNN